jgi:uncharacterized protein
MEAAGSASAVWWILSIGMILVGIAGTVLPALPGTALVFAGILLGAWIDDFTRVSGWTVGFIGLLAAAAFAVDYLAAVLGARRVGASRLALVGAAIGTVLGIFTGLIGLLFMPLVGAVIGEFLAQRRQPPAGDAVLARDGSVLVGGGPPSAQAAGQRAAQVGIATWIGLLVGTVAKVVLVFIMVGVFAAAVWI